MKVVSSLFKLACVGLLLTLAACGSPRGYGSYSSGYEPGERAYAEREATRLNRQQSFRLRAGGLFR